MNAVRPVDRLIAQMFAWPQAVLLALISWSHFVLLRQLSPMYQLRGFYVVRRQGIFLLQLRPWPFGFQGLRLNILVALVIGLVVLAARPPRLVVACEALALLLTLGGTFMAGTLRHGSFFYTAPRLLLAAVLALIAFALVTGGIVVLRRRPQATSA